MRRLAVAGTVVACLLAPLAAWAHPLGNFTTNQYVGIHVQPDSILVDYVLDLAEIPASQREREIDRDGDGTIADEESDAFVVDECRNRLQEIEVAVDGADLQLQAVDQAVARPEGEAGLTTLRLECRWEARVSVAAGNELTVRNGGFADRVGWAEMVLTAQGVSVESDLPAESITDRLRAYPENLLQSPVEVRTGTARLSPADGAQTGEPPPPIGSEQSIRTAPVDRLASLIDPAQGSVAIPLAMAVALGLGILHALAPGHGKTVMAAYLVGSRGTTSQAFGLGLAVAASHTVGVLALGVAILVGTSAFDPEKAFPILSLISGLIIMGIGIWMMVTWLRRRNRPDSDHGHVHSQGGVEHSHAVPAVLEGVAGWKVLASMGLAGGLVPSTSAIVLLLAAVNLGRIPLGILLISLFGLGMALTLVGVGLVLVKAGDYGMKRLGTREWINHARAIITPIAAVVVIGVGVFLSVSAL